MNIMNIVTICIVFILVIVQKSWTVRSPPLNNGDLTDNNYSGSSVIIPTKSQYKISAITPPTGILLTSPRWSTQENVLYCTDKYAQRLYRLDPDTNDLTQKLIDYGPAGTIETVQDAPGVVLVGVRTGLYLYRWGSPGGDLALRQLTNVDLKKPNNLISDSKVDNTGRLWFGTMGKLLPTDVVRDTATLYSMTEANVANPEVKIKPVTLTSGIAFSNDNKNMFFNDAITRRIVEYDYILNTGEIANKTLLFDFDKNKIPGVPYGMTIDIDDNLWVATFNGSKILKIDSKTGTLRDEITLPVDQISSVSWGGRDFSTLFVTTGKYLVKSPKPLSSSLFTIKNTGTRGLPPTAFLLPDASNEISDLD